MTTACTVCVDIQTTGENPCVLELRNYSVILTSWEVQIFLLHEQYNI